MAHGDTFVLNSALATKNTAGDVYYLNQSESFEFLESHKDFGIRITERLAKIQMILSPRADNYYRLSFAAITRNVNTEIPFRNLELGYLIFRTTWIPIDSNSIADNVSLLGDGSIHDLDAVSYSESLYLKVQGRRVSPEVLVQGDLEIAGARPIQIAPLIDATPYLYQVDGFQWLGWLSSSGVGGILGDEMGLGKTLQVIMLTKHEIDQGRWPNLIVCPSSLLENWKREFKRFIDLDVYVHHGDERKYRLSELSEYPVTITSYDAIRRDELVLGRVHWNLIAADEAQYIKNVHSQRHQSLRGLSKRIGIAVTGTPIENRLLDLWSIANFVIPGVLGDSDWFKRNFIEDRNGAELLREVIRPLVMRRRLKEVAKELPTITYKEVPLQLPTTIYDCYRALQQEVADKKLPILGTITRLRTLMAHADSESQLNENDDKFEYLRVSISELMENGNKAIIFAPYIKTLDLVVRWFSVDFPGYFVRKLTGETPIEQRQLLIDEFSNSSKPGILAMNAKVGGVGLNITAANHVFHFSPDWNPAVMDQASARIYRHGQKSPVTVHNMFYIDTIEEYMYQRLEAKRMLSETALRDQDEMPTLVELMMALEKVPHLEMTDE